MMQRKYSAPGQLCSMGGHMPTNINPTTGRKGSLCVTNQQFGYTGPTYSMTQWAQVGPVSSTAPPAGLQPGFLIPSGAHQSGNGCGSTNLRTTQASWNSCWRVGTRKREAVPCGVEIIGPSPFKWTCFIWQFTLERLPGPYNVTRVTQIWPNLLFKRLIDECVHLIKRHRKGLSCLKHQIYSLIIRIPSLL